MKKQFSLDKPSKRLGCYEPKREIVQLNINRGLPGILQQVALIICKSPNNSKSICLSYLNGAVKAVIKLRNKENNRTPLSDTVEASTLKETVAENWEDKVIKLKYYSLLKCALLYRQKEVRAAGIRLIRYITSSELDVLCIIECNIIPMIVRGIDITTENHIERVHAMRLTRDLLHLAPNLFPIGLARCLSAILLDDNKEKDRLLRTAQAILNELAVLNPNIFIECRGVTAFLYSIIDCSLPRINESLMSSLLFLLNDPSFRPYCSQFQMILSSFSAFFIPSDQKSELVQAGCLATLVALRAWSGLITLYQTEDNPLESLIKLLHLSNEDTRKIMIEFLYDLFRIPMCNGKHSNFRAALKERSNTIFSDPDSFRLHEGFIIAEAAAFLPHIAHYRPNLVENYLALILYTFMKKGLISALCDVIVTSSFELSIQTTLLLGEFLHFANQNLPIECSWTSQALPTLAVKAAGNDPNEKVKAAEAIGALLDLSRLLLKKKPVSEMSLYLRHLISTNREKDHLKVVTNTSDISKTIKWLNADHEDIVIQTFKDCGVLTDAISQWKWHLILSVLRWPSTSFKNLEELVHRNLVEKLLTYFKPSEQQFSKVDSSNQRNKLQADALLLFCKFLLHVPNEHEKYLLELLLDINTSLKAVACERLTHDAILSPSNLNSTLSQYYFLAIGVLTRSNKGYDLILKSGIFEQILHIIDISPSDIYAKLISTCLDYSINGINRSILNKILTSGKESSRVNATKLLRVFIRVKAQDFSHWGIDLLVGQLCDTSIVVANTALDVIDEALDNEEYLDAVLKATPTVPHLGDKGQLLLAKLVSSPKGFQSYHKCNYILTLLDKWAVNFNIKYVRLVQESLAESFTQLRRGEDGQYGRRSSGKHIVHDVFLLPHLYGSLTMHEEGFSILIKHECIKTLIQIIKRGSVSDYQEIYKLKAAIWALGHLGRSSRGVLFLQNEDIIKTLVHLAANCPVYSVRGTVFHSLCLISSTCEGSGVLKKFGWETVKRHRHQQTQTILEDESTSHQLEKFLKELSPARESDHYSKSDFTDKEEISSVPNVNFNVKTWRKSQTLPHDTKPQSYFGHQRSFSDCPVLEDSAMLFDHSLHQDLSFNKNRNRLKDRIVSSFKRKKRRDSVDSKGSNSSSTSSRFSSLLRSAKYFHRRKRKHSEGLEYTLEDSGTSRSHSFTDDEIDNSPVVISRLKPIASGASLSTIGDIPINRENINGSERIEGTSPCPISVLEKRNLECSYNSTFGSSPGVTRMANLSDSESLEYNCTPRGQFLSRGLSRVENVPSNVSGQCYLCLAIPKDLDDILLDKCIGNDDKHSSKQFPLFSEVQEKEFIKQKADKKKEDKEFSFEYHNETNCSRCQWLLISKNIENSEETDVPSHDRNLLRKEILKSVTNMISIQLCKLTRSSIYLMHLKHIQPKVFQDPCLYTEVHCLLSSYAFPLYCRRIIQEIFADIKLEEVFKNAERILNCELVEAVNEYVNEFPVYEKKTDFEFENFSSNLEEDC